MPARGQREGTDEQVEPLLLRQPSEEEHDRPRATVEETVAKLGRIGQGLEVLPAHAVREDHRPPPRRDARSEPRLLFQREMDCRGAAEHPPLPREVGEPLADAPAAPQPRIERAVDADDVGDALPARLLRRRVLRIEVQRVDVDDVVALHVLRQRAAQRARVREAVGPLDGEQADAHVPHAGDDLVRLDLGGVPGLRGEAEVGRVDSALDPLVARDAGQLDRGDGRPSCPRRDGGNDVQHPHSLAAARHADTIPSAHASMLYSRTSCCAARAELAPGAPRRRPAARGHPRAGPAAPPARRIRSSPDARGRRRTRPCR